MLNLRLRCKVQRLLNLPKLLSPLNLPNLNLPKLNRRKPFQSLSPLNLPNLLSPPNRHSLPNLLNLVNLLTLLSLLNLRNRRNHRSLPQLLLKLTVKHRKLNLKSQMRQVQLQLSQTLLKI